MPRLRPPAAASSTLACTGPTLGPHLRLGTGLASACSCDPAPGQHRQAAMSSLGDVDYRPDEDFVVVPATPKMQQKSAMISTNVAVALFKDGRKDVPCHKVAAAFATTFGYRKADVSVVRHLPEQFFVR
ncbi:hypothetical protein ZWY2020_057379 [Hordeum vulgare]|nr:hypothetical protein ZWY2020_057379 [Hordeum vulgare]